MKLLTFLLLTGVIALAGCGRKQAAEVNHHEQLAEAGISYSAKNGLLVSPETSRFIGLETVEVSERPITVAKEITARVFRAPTTTEPWALASAIVSPTDAASLRPGQASIQTSTAPEAEILRLDHSGETETQTVEAILRLPKATSPLRESDGITVTFATGSPNAVLVVPNAALLHTTAGDFVYLENGAHFVRAAVKGGRTDGEFTEITDGLVAGDKVVVRATMTLWMTELHHVNGGDACCIRQDKK